MKFFTTFDTVFVFLALLQMLECYVRIRVSLYHRFTDQAEAYQKKKRKIEAASIVAWVLVLFAAGSHSFEGMTTFLLYCIIARAAFVIVWMRYNDKQDLEFGAAF